MIGTTTFKFRLEPEKEVKKDQSPRSMVLAWAIIALLIGGQRADSQTPTGAKSKAVATQAPDLNAPSKDKGSKNTKSIREADKIENEAAAKIDDNRDDDDVEEDSPTAEKQDDNGEDVADANDKEASETLEANPQQNEEKLADDEEEVAKEEIAPIPPPPDEPLKKEAKTAVESVPVQSDQDSAQEKSTEADMVEVIPREKSVEIEPRKKYLSYRDRRTKHGFLFNINAENLYFPDYASIIDKQLYETMFGQEDVTLLQIQMSYKFNFFLGALSAGAGYGQGILEDNRLYSEAKAAYLERSLKIEKKSLNAQWQLDSLMREPYFVPYVGASYWQMTLTENDKTQGKDAVLDTGNGTSFTVGFLVQLNWLEPDAARVGYMGQGLENTFLDIFWTQYQNTDTETDPELVNDFNFGAGLRLEF